MSTNSKTEDIGLRGVLVADTKISLIDAIQGELSYRGYDIHDLASYSTYEEVAYLLLQGNLPNSLQLEEFSNNLKKERQLPQDIVTLLERIPKTFAPMDVLQATVALLSGFDPELRDDSKDAEKRKAIRLIAKVPTMIAAWERIRHNLPPIMPDKDLSHSANFLKMLKGEPPEDETAKDLDVCLVLHAEHSFNASTFTARVVASTRAHMYTSVAAAIGALSGELHGGANSQVMRNLQEIGEPEKVDKWVESKLNQSELIMGMGHAVYKSMDPRADVLQHLAERIARRTGEPKWYLITRRIEKITQQEIRKRKGHEIYANVDLFSPSVYYLIGIALDLFTPVFALSRIAGWTAHIIEEKFPEPPAKPTLYRPSSEYRGNYCGPVGCKYVPLEKRLDFSNQNQ